MSSIIEGYNYDIFISYRQKDNKGDRWVSNFVDALKTELEATFKEDVSIYFDENPHDRLQETHNVDKSLEGKLNCLIFIPILSQTYCDPKSYAWQNEFLAFVKTTENDRFGKNVKLRSGNVAGRILPIRIHDLEQEDIKLFEKETGSVLRALDFVFKTSTGVSRPLKANEDHPQDNLNKTFYSDQINKVGHAIKEIILGMKTEPVQVMKEKDKLEESFKEIREKERRIDLENPIKAGRGKILIPVTIVALLIVAGIIAYPILFKRDTLKSLREKGKISVAVMPFQNMTNDTVWNIWQDGIQDMLITSLSNNPEELSVRQIESVKTLIQDKGITNYASLTPSIAGTISQKLDASVFIYGSIKRAGSTIRVYAQLIDSKTEEVFKSFQIEGTAKEENIFTVIDSLSVMVNDFLIISKLKKGANPAVVKLQATTKYPEAFKCVIIGDNAFFANNDFSTAISMYMQAIAIDSNYLYPAIMISYSYWNQFLYEEGKKWCQKVYEKRDQMPLTIKTSANVIHALYYETPYESIKYLRQLLEIDDQSPDVYTDIGFDYNRLEQYSRAIPELEKALEIYEKWGIKPLWSVNYANLLLSYHRMGQYKKAKTLIKKADKDFPDDLYLTYAHVILSFVESDTVTANQYIERFITLGKDYSLPEAEIMYRVAEIYNEVSILNKSEEYYRKSLSVLPKSPSLMNNLAYFLIDKDRNINEGMEIVNKGLELNPDDYSFLHTKGWGLYKQGKSQEALSILQKSWDLRRVKAIYDHEAYLHLEAAKKAVASQKNN